MRPPLIQHWRLQQAVCPRRIHQRDIGNQGNDEPEFPRFRHLAGLHARKIQLDHADLAEHHAK
ncbi:hypothetical protein [Marinobacter sp. es.048]|uniref:hypothetical protein n=1 Tax=Marinobacter sp. es.048 TaxID=1761795 RepID=UPI0015562A80|nr:hypothetical protein [Marinobacter sp. es.048]